MTKVIHLAGRTAGNPLQSSARAEALTPDRQAAIENALSMAQYFLRHANAAPANLWAATARTNRALTLLKQASEGAANLPRRVQS